jgi:hypothetical protein
MRGRNLKRFITGHFIGGYVRNVQEKESEMNITEKP